jgi:hypothetical protein
MSVVRSHLAGTTSNQDGESERRNVMFQSKGSGKSFATRATRRLAVIIFAGGMVLGATTTPVSATSLLGDGVVYANVNCDWHTRHADIQVYVKEPMAYATSGFYFYTIVWTKPRNATTWTNQGSWQTPLVKTGTSLGYGVIQYDRANIWNGYFDANAHGYYDILVQYWYWAAGATRWSDPYGFIVATDRDSAIYGPNVFPNIYGYWGRSTDCYL